MRQPDCLTPLVDLGIIQEVVRPLMSGKEAQIYLVVSDDELRVAKVYKAAQNRSFRQRVEYTEGRAVRNTRTQRAMNSHSHYGRAQDEANWRSAEVDIIYRLRAAGVRVPEPYHFSDGILVMELVTDADGDPAPRLADLKVDRAEVRAIFTILLTEVIKMLCAGVVHGDLSEFNVLMGQDGPVLIDFPQAVDPAHNQNARKLLIRDIDNLSRFVAHVAPGQQLLPFGQELWNLYTRGELTPETQLTGRYQSSQRKADTSAVLREIEEVAHEAQKRRDTRGPIPGRRGRKARPSPQVTIIGAKMVMPAPNVPNIASPAQKTGADKSRIASPAQKTGADKSRITSPAQKTGAGSNPAPETKPTPSNRRRRRRRRAGKVTT